MPHRQKARRCSDHEGAPQVDVSCLHQAANVPFYAESSKAQLQSSKDDLLEILRRQNAQISELRGLSLETLALAEADTDSKWVRSVRPKAEQ